MEHAQSSGPWFCPGCRRPATPTAYSKACAHCGDRLISKGYCPVCEDFLSLPAGDSCPKHQITLESHAPPGLTGRLADESSAWVEVGHYADSLACQPPRIRLEAEGIPTMIDGERMGDRSMYSVATGGVLLRVPENLADEARIILSQTWSATAAALDIEEDWPDDEEGEVPAREPDTHHFAPENVSPLASLAVLALGLALILAALTFLNWFKTN
ncbi:hypothetical protein BSF38_04706 [Paludisphaera borealis]|uniref:Uncharacterized protein n=2 Tax=Paludisphaera borealis TaxID=1387353 RepID=A0A1U7CW38_9BACT|nr:hypothetical protein BSF38_04706 [Paludisphaera borealis]